MNSINSENGQDVDQYVLFYRNNTQSYLNNRCLSHEIYKYHRAHIIHKYMQKCTKFQSCKISTNELGGITIAEFPSGRVSRKDRTLYWGVAHAQGMNYREPLQIGQRSALYIIISDSAPTKREGAPKSICTEIRERTASDNESSWARGEDSPYPSPQGLARSARVAKTHVHEMDLAGLYEDARWRIRTFVFALRAFLQTTETTPKLKFCTYLNLYIGVHWFDPQFGQFPGTLQILYKTHAK